MPSILLRDLLATCQSISYNTTYCEFLIVRTVTNQQLLYESDTLLNLLLSVLSLSPDVNCSNRAFTEKRVMI